MDSRQIAEEVESFLKLHPNATLVSTAERLGVSPSEIERGLKEAEGNSFQDFRLNRRLLEAFRQLNSERAVPPGPWEKTRARPRRIIPKTTVRYCVRRFWVRKRSYSNPCPLVDLSSGGLGLLADDAPMPGKRVSLLLKFAGKDEEVRAEGKVVYKVATGIAGFRCRVGIEFLQPLNLETE